MSGPARVDRLRGPGFAVPERTPPSWVGATSSKSMFSVVKKPVLDEGKQYPGASPAVSYTHLTLPTICSV
eukprot:989389-Alexandrium_andersonii.AAC.1